MQKNNIKLRTICNYSNCREITLVNKQNVRKSNNRIYIKKKKKICKFTVIPKLSSYHM